MAICAICGKHKASGNKVSHSNIKTKRIWKPNLQPVRVVLGGQKKKIVVCTRCLRSGRVRRAV